MWFHQVAQLIHKDTPVVLVVIAVVADLFVALLRRFDFSKIFGKATNQRKGTHTGFGFGGVLRIHFCFAVHLYGGGRVLDGNGATFKVDGVPF